MIKETLIDTFRSPAISELVLGIAIGVLGRPEAVYAGFYEPLVRGLIGFSSGMLAHHLTGFSAGGVVLMAVMAASGPDISGPPTLRGALPEANPSAYTGASTGLGTPVEILSIPLFIALADFMTGR